MNIYLRTMICATGALSAATCICASDYVPTVREDRIWEYSGCDVNGMHRYDENSWNSLVAYHFVKFVEKRKVGENEYSRLAVVRTKKYSSMFETNEFGPNFLMSDEEKDMSLCWLREDDGVVYRLDDSPHRNPVCEIPANADPDRFVETVIYNWNLNEGEKMTLCRLPDDSGVEEDFSVHYLPPTCVGGTVCRVMTFADDHFVKAVDDRFYIIEGIGANYNGHLGVYFLDLMTGTANNAESPGIQSVLKRVYDGDGNLIYGEEMPGPSAIEGIFDDDCISGDIIYDILGRRVRSTVPGGVYIRGGKKFVAR
ncbi:MAG: hypothetical protein K2I45_03955 [Muribaculaceae bacterium]|nr:hypothetical protein [Muribaculaceae bacterium]